MGAYTLSKSSYIRGLQCHKSLYLYKNHFKLRDPLSPEMQEKFKTGHDFGELAQQLFPGGVNAKPRTVYEFELSVRKTADFISKGKKAIYEAAFAYDEVIVALDILAKHNNQWIAYEVKNSFEITPTYINDAALQYYVINNSGIALVDFCIIFRKEVYENIVSPDLNEIFSIESVLENVIELQDFVSEKIREFKIAAFDKSVLGIPMGEHCQTPYPCDYMGYCTRQNKTDG